MKQSEGSWSHARSCKRHIGPWNCEQQQSYVWRPCPQKLPVYVYIYSYTVEMYLSWLFIHPINITIYLLFVFRKPLFLLCWYQGKNQSQTVCCNFFKLLQVCLVPGPILCGTANSHRLRELTVAFLLCVMRFTFIVFLIKSSSIQVVVHVATGFNRLGRFSITRWWKRCSFGLILHIFSFQPAPAPPTQHTRRHSGHQSRSLALVDVPLRTSQH